MTNKMLIAVLMTFSLSSSLVALNLFRTKSKGYEVAPANGYPEALKRLLRIDRLSDNHQNEVADICLRYPDACVGSTVFSKLDVNFVMKDQMSFLYKLYLQSTQEKDDYLREGSQKLFDEAMTEIGINPHQKNIVEDDLALAILRFGDNALIEELMRLEKFNPNATYGALCYPLATMLIFYKRLDLALKVANFWSFDENLRDNENKKPAFYLLSKFNSDDCKLFLTLMKQKPGEWDMRGLGLYKAENFNLLFEKILPDDSTRLVVLKNILIKFLIWQQQYERGEDRKISSAIKEAFFDDFGKPKTFVNPSFTKQALELMMNLNLMHIIDEKGLEQGRYWYKELPPLKELNDAKLVFESSVPSIEQWKCAACPKFSPWSLTIANVICNHQCCSICYFEAFQKNKQAIIRCPAPDCGTFITPAMFLSFREKHKVDDQKTEAIERAYNFCMQGQENIKNEYQKAIKGFTECPNCSKGLIFDAEMKETRLVECSCRNKFVLSPALKDVLIPVEFFPNLRVCSNCQTPVDLLEEAAPCPFCKQASTWQHLN